ncbi:MAG: signal recognition particle protein [Planctomycetes bacterium]|nr:signal recognition particle protein [Planctomycetota bacterium]
MFESLSEKVQSTFRNISGRGRIDEDGVRSAMDDVRTALLEADVHQDVVKQFCDEVVIEAIGQEVTKSLKPGEEMIGLVHQKLIDLMSPPQGTSTDPIMLVEPAPTIVMLCGLQGSGKTTTCGKLAAYLKQRGRSVMLAAADLQRPAAVEQLKIVAEQVDTEGKGNVKVHFYAEPDKCSEYGKATGVAVGVCLRALGEARKAKVDVLILDTAGRLHIDNDLMKELEGINRALNPHQIYLIVDAMVGQDAVNSAKAFHQRLAVDGIILTKFDSDTRGGAALSVKSVTGAPIKFIGVGERFDALEEFHPQRMAGRILGMGDVVSLVEKAQAEVSEEDAEKLAEKMASGKLTMDDFVKQLKSIRRMGPMKQLLGMLPGVGSMLKNVQVDEKQLDQLEGMVNSMTKKERDDIKLLNKSRIKRIAKGSGTTPTDVNKLTKQFEMMQKMTKQMAGTGFGGKMKAMKEMSKGGGNLIPGMSNMPTLGGRGSTKTLGVKSKFKQRKKRK